MKLEEFFSTPPTLGKVTRFIGIHTTTIKTQGSPEVVGGRFYTRDGEELYRYVMRNTQDQINESHGSHNKIYEMSKNEFVLIHVYDFIHGITHDSNLAQIVSEQFLLSVRHVRRVELLRRLMGAESYEEQEGILGMFELGRA